MNISGQTGYFMTSGTYFKEYEPERFLYDHIFERRNHQFTHISGADSRFGDTYLLDEDGLDDARADKLSRSEVRCLFYNYGRYWKEYKAASGTTPFPTAVAASSIRQTEPIYWYYDDYGVSGNCVRVFTKTISYPFSDGSIPSGDPIYVTVPSLSGQAPLMSGAKPHTRDDVVYHPETLILHFHQADDLAGQVQKKYQAMFENPHYEMRFAGLPTNLIPGNNRNIGIANPTTDINWLDDNLNNAFGTTNNQYMNFPNVPRGLFWHRNLHFSGVPCPALPKYLMCQLNNLNLQPTGWLTKSDLLASGSGIYPGLSGHAPDTMIIQQLTMAHPLVTNHATKFAVSGVGHIEKFGIIGEDDYISSGIQEIYAPQIVVTDPVFYQVSGMTTDLFRAVVSFDTVEPLDVRVSGYANINPVSFSGVVTDRWGNTNGASWSWEPYFILAVKNETRGAKGSDYVTSGIIVPATGVCAVVDVTTSGFSQQPEYFARAVDIQHKYFDGFGTRINTFPYSSGDNQRQYQGHIAEMILFWRLCGYGVASHNNVVSVASPDLTFSTGDFSLFVNDIEIPFTERTIDIYDRVQAPPSSDFLNYYREVDTGVNQEAITAGAFASHPGENYLYGYADQGDDIYSIGSGIKPLLDLCTWGVEEASISGIYVSESNGDYDASGDAAGIRYTLGRLKIVNGLGETLFPVSGSTIFFSAYEANIDDDGTWISNSGCFTIRVGESPYPAAGGYVPRINPQYREDSVVTSGYWQTLPAHNYSNWCGSRLILEASGGFDAHYNTTPVFLPGSSYYFNGPGIDTLQAPECLDVDGNPLQDDIRFGPFASGNPPSAAGRSFEVRDLTIDVRIKKYCAGLSNGDLVNPISSGVGKVSHAGLTATVGSEASSVVNFPVVLDSWW